MEEKILIILKDIQSKITSMDSRMDSMESKITSMDSKITSIDTDVKGIKVQLNEHGQILKALEHSLAVNNAKQEVMERDIIYIKGDTTAIKNDLCFVEQATAKNWYDIAHLKAIK